MGGFKWLHFLDLHFSMQDSFDTGLARQSLLECLAREKLACDYVFITGDIANQNDYSAAKEFVTELLSRVKVDAQNVFWAVGNHDIKRGSKLRDSIIGNIRKAKDPAHEFEAAMADEEMRTILTYSGMADYIQQYDLLFGRKLSAAEISDAHVYHPLEQCNLVVLNTCLTSCDNEDTHKLMH